MAGLFVRRFSGVFLDEDFTELTLTLDKDMKVTKIEGRDDFRLAPGSPCAGSAAALPPELAGLHVGLHARDLGASPHP